LRRYVESLPADYGTFVFLLLNGDSFTSDFLSKDELVERCAAVGNEKLLLFLAGKPFTDDPDMAWRKDGPWGYSNAQLFILRNAKRLLKPTDVPGLKECQSTLNRPDWAIAMAELSGERPRDLARSAAALRRAVHGV